MQMSSSPPLTRERANEFFVLLRGGIRNLCMGCLLSCYYMYMIAVLIL